MLEKVYTVYKTINLVNGKFYIGVHKTTNPNDQYLGSGKYLKRAIQKYGLDNFQKEILAIFNSPDDAFRLEGELVTFDLIETGMYYNIKEGGIGGFDYINKILTKKDRINRGKIGGLSTKKRFKNDPIIRERESKANSERLKKLHAEGKFKHQYLTGQERKGKVNSKEHCQQISKAQAGAGNSQFGTCWIMKAGENKKIKRSDQQIWLDLGWQRGRKL